MITQYEHIGSLMFEYGTSTLQKLGRGLYDDTDCGVNVAFITTKGELYEGDLTPKMDVTWALRNIVGIRIGTIVEGSDAEYTADNLMFPFDVSELEDSLAECEAFAEENFEEEE